jgi:hypothetical protein
MNRIGLKQTPSVQILAVCFMLCGIAAGQANQVIQQTASGAQRPNAAVSSSSQLRWYSAQGGLFSSVAEACQAGFMTLQTMFDKINHLPKVKSPVMTVSMLPPTATAYAGAPSINCNYMIKGPQGAQERSIGLVAVCASPGNVTPAPKFLSCGSVNVTQAPASPQVPQTTAIGAKSASPPDSAATLLAYLQQAQNSFQGATSPKDSRNDQALAATAGNAPGSMSSATPTSPAADAGSSVPSPSIGSFKGSDVVLTAYGCFRTGAVVLCDFDVTKQNSAPFKASVLWSSLGLRDDSGRVSKRHDVFFLADDGTRQPLTTLSTNPVRLIMEFTEVDAQLSSVSLVNGQEQISGVPIDMTDPGQPEGTVPDRSASVVAVTGAPAAPLVAPSNSQIQPSSSAKTNVNPLDAANHAIDKAGATVNKVNQGAAKAKDAKDTVKGIANALKSLGR